MAEIVTDLLDTPVAKDIDSLITEHIQTSFPALGICVYHQGRVVLNQCWGWISPNQQDYPITPDTIFDLASITKVFVHTALLTFISDGTISLDSKLVDVIPEFGHINPRPIDGGQDPFTGEELPADTAFVNQKIDATQITFQHVMTHTSGIAPWRDVYNKASQNPPMSPRANATIDQQRWINALRAIIGYPFVGTIGDTVRYSDIGMILLGEAVARLNNSTLDIAVRERVSDPLGLKSVTYNPVINGISLSQIVPTEIDNRWRNRRTWGEVHDENACGIGGVAGHAGLFSNAYDVGTLGQAWLSGDERLSINPELRLKATQQHANGQFRMGLGWMLKAFENSSAGDKFSQNSYGHTGFTGTSLWVDPEQDLVCAVLTNHVYHGRDAQGIHQFRRAIHDLIATGVESL